MSATAADLSLDWSDPSPSAAALAFNGFLVAQARAARKRGQPARPLKTFIRPVDLFERTWQGFPQGLLPIPLLFAVSKKLCAIVAFERDYDQPYHTLCGDESAPVWNSAPALLYDVELVKSYDEHTVRFLLRSELERLLRFMRPRKTATDWSCQFAILGTLRRLGQLYIACKRVWRAKQAQAMLLEEAERLWQAALNVQQLLEDTGYATRRRPSAL
jgi:hypothetical protein